MYIQKNILEFFYNEIEENYKIIAPKAREIAWLLIFFHVAFYIIWVNILHYNWDSLIVRLVGILLILPFIIRIRRFRINYCVLFYLNIIYHGCVFTSFITVSSNYTKFWEIALLGLSPILVLFTRGVSLNVISFLANLLFFLLFEKIIGQWKAENLSFILFQFAPLSAFQYFSVYYLKSNLIAHYTEFNIKAIEINSLVKNSHSSKPLQAISDSYQLTKRQKEIIILFMNGISDSKVMGEKLYISASTINNHFFKIFQIFKVSNRKELKKIINEKISEIQSLE